MPTRTPQQDDLDKFVDDRLGWKRVADRLALDLAVQRRIVAEQAAVIEAAREPVERALAALEEPS